MRAGEANAVNRLSELLLYPVLAIAALAVVFYPAFLVKNLPLRLALMYFGLLALVTCGYRIHWHRTPGSFKRKSIWRWLSHILLASVFLVAAPILGVLHAAGVPVFAPHGNLSKLLGLEPPINSAQENPRE